jgi:hypothetical protein
MARSGVAWHGMAGKAGHGVSRPGTARHGRHGMARRGAARHGQVRQAWFFVSVSIDGVDRDEDTRSEVEAAC